MTERHYDSGWKAPDGHVEVKFAREGDIVFSAMFGKLRTDDADVLLKSHRDWDAKIGKRFQHVMDITSFDGEEPEARQKMTKACLSGPDSPFADFAIVGGNFATRTLFNLYAKVSKIPMKIFATEADALVWLKEK